MSTRKAGVKKKYDGLLNGSTKLWFFFATICTKTGLNYVQVYRGPAHDSKRSFYSYFLQVKKMVFVKKNLRWAGKIRAVKHLAHSVSVTLFLKTSPNRCKWLKKWIWLIEISFGHWISLSNCFSFNVTKLLRSQLCCLYFHLYLGLWTMLVGLGRSKVTQA